MADLTDLWRLARRRLVLADEREALAGQLARLTDRLADVDKTLAALDCTALSQMQAMATTQRLALVPDPARRVTIDAAAKLANRSAATVFGWVRRGDVPAVGGLVLPDDVRLMSSRAKRQRAQGRGTRQRTRPDGTTERLWLCRNTTRRARAVGLGRPSTVPDPAGVWLSDAERTQVKGAR